MIPTIGHSNAKRTLKTNKNVQDYLQLSILETMSTVDIHSFILLINTNKQVLTYKSQEAERRTNQLRGWVHSSIRVAELS